MPWFGKEGEVRGDAYDQARFEDDSWNDPSIIGIVVALAIVLLVVGVGAWLDGCGCLVGAVDLLRGDR